MTPDEYLAERIEGQIEWFDRKSGWNKRWFMRLRTLEIICASTIPLLAGLCLADLIGLVVGILGVTVAVVAAIVTLTGLQENWVSYRGMSEMLQQHRFKYLTRVNPYDRDDAFQILVRNVEDALSEERTSWREQTTAAADETAAGLKL